MKVLLYAAQHTESGERLQQAMETMASLKSLTSCRNFSELVGYLQTPDPPATVVILQAANMEELEAFEMFRFRLERLFFILVLPDTDKETIAKGHRLRPRFIVYQDSDFREVIAVLDRLGARQDRHPGGFLSPSVGIYG